MTGRSKYYSKKVTVDGITFDSKKEYLRYRELMLLESAGVISGLELQKRFELIPAQYETYARYGKRGQRLKDGRRCVEQSVCYVADFYYKDKNGDPVVEDTKGYRNPSTSGYAYFVLKRKLMLYVHGIRIREI